VGDLPTYSPFRRTNLSPFQKQATRRLGEQFSKYPKQTEKSSIYEKPEVSVINWKFEEVKLAFIKAILTSEAWDQ